MLVAVIDLGKTNSKVALVDTAQAQEVQVLTQPATVNVKTQFPSIDHESIQSFTFNAISKLAKEFHIDAITVTTHGATAALLDAQGELALPVLDYEFRDIDNLRSDYNKYKPLFNVRTSATTVFQPRRCNAVANVAASHTQLRPTERAHFTLCCRANRSVTIDPCVYRYS